MKEFIRKYLVEYINEVVKLKHFNDRVEDRILNPETSTFATNAPQGVKDEVMKNISYLDKFDLTGQDNIGVVLYSSKTPYTYRKIVDGKLEVNTGNVLWGVIRGNEIETVIWYNGEEKPKNIQIKLIMNNIINYVENHAKNRKLTDKDLVRLTTKQIPVNPQKNTLPIINIDGVRWEVDKTNMVMNKKNKPNEKYKIDGIFNNFDAETQEILLSLL